NVLPVLQQGKQLLFAKGELLVSGVSLALGGYLGWQGISGLMVI
ncbi:MAG: GAP family protein, partial [Prochlorococcus sp.]